MRKLTKGLLATGCAMGLAVGMSQTAFAAHHNPSRGYGDGDSSSSSPYTKIRLSNGSCDAFNLKVSLTDDGPRDQNIVGAICTPKGGSKGNEVQVVTSGATYDGLFVHPSFDTKKYSYLDHAVNAGRTVIVYDRVGTGHSSYPDPDKVTIQAAASVLHQLINEAKSGGIGTGKHYRSVISIAHSLGSVVALSESAKYNDVSAILAASDTHTVLPSAQALLDSYGPARDQGGRFADLPAGYATTQPGDRGLFYDPGEFEPGMVDVDEQTKSVTSSGEQATTGAAAGDSQRVKVPVLLVVGEKDFIFANDENAINEEAKQFSQSPCVQFSQVPNTNHAVFTSKSAPDFFDLANRYTAPDSDHCAPLTNGALTSRVIFQQ